MLLITQRNWLGSGFKADCVESTRVNPTMSLSVFRGLQPLSSTDPSTVSGHVVVAKYQNALNLSFNNCL